MNFFDRILNFFRHAPTPAPYVAPTPTPAFNSPAPAAGNAPAATPNPQAAASEPSPGATTVTPPVEITITPVKPQTRDASVLGELIVNALPESKFPGVAVCYSRVIAWYCSRFEIADGDYAQAYQDVVIDKLDRPWAERMPYASSSEANFTTGRFPVADYINDVPASLFLAVLRGRYGAVTKGRNIWIDFINGPDLQVGAFINLGSSTNSGLIATFNPDSYSSPLADAVRSAMPSS